MKIHHIVFVNRGEAVLQESNLPEPGPGEVLIQTMVSLVSPGTERAFFLGLPNTTQTYPQYTGYSNVGEVADLGEGVTTLQIGQRVVSPAHHAAFVNVPADSCQPVPSSVADEEAAFFNLGAIALQGVRKARLELGESVTVMGAGLIGLLAMQLAQLSGGLPVISVDVDRGRLGFAERVGADATLVSTENVTASLGELLDSEGADVVIEATGHPAAVPTAFALARPGGRIVLLGSTRGETENVNFYRDVHRKGLTVIGAHNIARPRVDSYPGRWTQSDDQSVILALLAHDRIAIQPLITDRFSWREALQAYDLLKQWDHETMGMIIDWGGYQ